MANKEVLTHYGILVLAIASFGGVLFGYHAAVISGALVFLTPAFDLSPSQEGMIVSIMLLGGLAGAFLAGYLADRLGRKKTMLISAFLFIAGAMTIAMASNYELLLIGRTISGFAAGITTVAVPIYLSEISPPDYRGRCVSAFQLSIAGGILLSYAIAFALSGGQKWQILFFIGVLLAFLQLLALFFIPETPSWLFTHGKVPKGMKALNALRADKNWEKEIEQMDKKSPKKSQWAAFFHPHMTYILFLGFMLSLFQQITGINAVIYYTPKIFTLSGIESSDAAFLATLGVGVINFLATLFSVWVLDKSGRRSLMLVGPLGMVIGLGVLCYGFFSTSDISPILTLSGLLFYVACYSFSLGPVIWVLLSEIFPLKIRGNAMACALTLNWLANYAISLTFPNMLSAWGGGGAFAFFAVISLFVFIFVYYFIPETKGKTLEEIETLVDEGKFRVR